MRPYNRYLLALTALFLATTVVVSFREGSRLDLYFSLYLIEYLGVTLTFAYLRPRARRLLGAMTFILLAGFLGIVAVKVTQILWGLMG